MDTNKLLKAIQILVEEEVKKQLPAIKASVRKEIMAEMKISKNVQKSPLSMAKAILEDDATITESKPKVKKRYSSNPLLNDVLNETAGGIAGDMGDSDFRTMNFGSSDMQSVAGRQIIASKFGYGDMMNVTTTSPDGRPLDIQNPNAEVVLNAMNRDYSQLVKRFNK
jgi:hypothetical protein